MNYKNKAKEVAKELIGKTIKINGLGLVEIIEAEPFEGGNQTKRRSCMKLAPGQIGIMPYRGHYFMNVGTEKAGVPSCVLIRAVKIGDKIYDGPGKVGKVLNAEDLEYKILGKDILEGGKTKLSVCYTPKDKTSNSLGRYKSKYG